MKTGQEVGERVAEGLGPQGEINRFEGFLRRLMGGEASPFPVAKLQALLGVLKVPLGLPHPVARPVHALPPEGASWGLRASATKAAITPSIRPKATARAKRRPRLGATFS